MTRIPRTSCQRPGCACDGPLISVIPPGLQRRGRHRGGDLLRARPKPRRFRADRHRRLLPGRQFARGDPARGSRARRPRPHRGGARTQPRAGRSPQCRHRAGARALHRPAGSGRPLEAGALRSTDRLPGGKPRLRHGRDTGRDLGRRHLHRPGTRPPDSQQHAAARPADQQPLRPRLRHAAPRRVRHRRALLHRPHPPATGRLRDVVTRRARASRWPTCQSGS